VVREAYELPVTSMSHPLIMRSYVGHTALHGAM
jgi:hypothetical protein